MTTIEEEILAIKKEIAKTQKNKATEYHIGSLYGKIAKLKEKQDKQAGRSGGNKIQYSIKKSGDATIALIGFPSVGKSTLINSITNANSEVAAYEFTTLAPVPGMMFYNDAKIQIVDLPGIISNASSGKGRGKEILSVARNADLIAIVLDINKLENLNTIKDELHKSGVRLDRKPPRVIFKKVYKGGIKILSTYTLTKLTETIIKQIMRSYGFSNGEVIIREDISPEDFIDALLGNRVYIPSILIINKADSVSEKKLKKIKKQYSKDSIFISAKNKKGLENLKKKIFDITRIMRIYLKPKGKPADMDKPIILHKGDSIYDLCLKLHKNFVEFFRYALVWGPSAKFDAQKLGINHILKDKDIVTIVI